MQKLNAFFRFLLTRIFSILNIPAFIYDTVIVPFVSLSLYRDFYACAKERINKSQNILDVGVGTGTALHSIIENIPPTTNVLGLDIDPMYVKSAQARFARRKNVEVRLQDFYEMEGSQQKYDIIIFSMSIMLMPDQKRAINIAKTLLNDGGRIYFLLTLNAKRNKILENIKPIIKYVTTIDFGKVTYENEFDSLRESCGLVTVTKHRVMPPMNLLLKVARLFTIECAPQEGTHEMNTSFIAMKNDN